MAASGDGSRPPASSFIEAEAEESGAEAGNDSEDEAAERDTGEGLSGFIADEAEGAAAAAEGGDSSSSDDGLADEELLEDDLAVLAEAGVDISQVQQPRKREAPGAAAASSGEPSARRPRLEGRSLEAELFGEEDDGDVGAGAAASSRADARRGGLAAAVAAALPDDFGDLSDDSVDDFIVEDPAAPKRRHGGAGDRELDITHDQRQEIIDIFGDTSVLRPLDEIAMVEEADEPPAPMALVARDPSPGPQQSTPRSLRGHSPLRSLVPASGAIGTMAPGSVGHASSVGGAIVEKAAAAETADTPQRWLETYASDPNLVDRDGLRRWLDDEEQCEAKWIYQEAFYDKDVDAAQDTKVEKVRAIREILKMLHVQKLEPIVVVTQFEFAFARLMWKDDILEVCKLDQQDWPRVWIKFKRLVQWQEAVANEAQLPPHILTRIDERVFDQPQAEINIKDTYDWFCAMYPEKVPSIEGKPQAQTSESQRILAARRHKFDEKLGLKDSFEQMTLQAFGISPKELGDNIENGKQIFRPNADMDETEKLKVVCERHINETFKSAASVEETVMLYLAHLIASEPRVRNYVRKHFYDMCAISTFVTEAGKPIAQNAAHGFKRAYRAFHIVNRPIDQFDKDDELFLDALNLEREGFLTVEYSLIQSERGSDGTPDAYKYVLIGRDSDGLYRDRQRLAEHFKKIEAAPDKKYVPNDNRQDITKWNWCMGMQPRLEAVARSCEIRIRRQSMRENAAKIKDLYTCAQMRFGFDTLHPFMVEDPILAFLLKMYCRTEDSSATEVFVVPGDWNASRKRVLLRALRDELYPMFWAEVRAKLATRAEEAVCRAAAASLHSIVNMQPWRPDENDVHEYDANANYDDDDALQVHVEDDAYKRDPEVRQGMDALTQGYCSVLVVAPEIQAEFSIVSMVNAFGNPVDMRKLFSKFHDSKFLDALPRPGDDPKSHQAIKKVKIREHRDVFKSMLSMHSPSLVVLPIFGPDVVIMKTNISQLVEDVHKERPFKVKPHILLIDPSVPRVVAYNERINQEGVYRDCETPLERMTISMARHVQDPLAEVCQLWHESYRENGLLKLRLHRLQHVVPRGRLARALLMPLFEAIANCGVHANRLRQSPHLMSVITFLPGFGSSKVELFRKCVNTAVTSRAELAARILKNLEGGRLSDGQDPMKTYIAANCMPFIRICPDLRDRWTISMTPAFDRTRLSEAHRAWLTAMCQSAVAGMELPQMDDEERRRYDESEPVAQAMIVFGKDSSLKTRLENLLWDDWDWAKSAGETFPEFANADALMDFLTSEVLNPFNDKRWDYSEPPKEAVFRLVCADSADSICPGSLVHTVVTQDLEFEGNPRPMVKVKVLPSMLNGSFQKQYRAGHGEGYIPGCNRAFRRNETVIARVRQTVADLGRNAAVILTVDMDVSLFAADFPITETDAWYFVPMEAENWTKTQLGAVVEAKETELRELKKWVRRPRNIRHPNWVDNNFDLALKAIDMYPLGNVLFRPSKRHDVILAMLKVRATDGTDLDDDIVEPKDCFRTFDVIEKDNKTISLGFELAGHLEVDGVQYKDFDEIIARHCDPIMDNLRLMREHHKFGLRNGEVTGRHEVKDAVWKFSKDDQRLLYYAMVLNPALVGHGLLIWALGGKQPREEFIEVHPRGFSLWGKPFDKIDNLIKWFKSVGWRNATRLRRDFKEAWERRRQEAKELRGKDAFEDMPRKRSSTWAAGTTTSGLQTPGGLGSGLMTPSQYMPEAAAPTPGGLSTPGAASRTPGGGVVPSTPRGVPATPRGVPATPGGVGVPATPGGMAPGTPMVPGMGFVQRGAPGAAPSTPFGFGHVPAMPSMMPGTPAAIGGLGGMPASPAGLMSGVPATPAGLAPASPAHLARGQPATPAGLAPASPAGIQMGMPSTPAAFQRPGYMPMTPVGMRFQPQSPGSLYPGTLGPASATPAGAPPPSPSGLKLGSQPRTPGAAR